MNTLKEHTLVMVRGLPGSGKSTLCRLLSEEGKYPVFSFDDYFTDATTGEYDFRHEDNHIAYKHCAERVEEAMQKSVVRIFLDNCFTLEWEMEPYFKLAKQFGYRMMAVTVENRHGGINNHGISNEQVQKMAAKYKVVLVPE